MSKSGSKGKGKGKPHFRRGKGKGGYHAAFTPTIPASSLAGGKGKKGPPRNPVGTDGQVMRCFECNSDQHLASNCPHKRGKGKGKGKSYIVSPQDDAAQASITS